MSRVIRFCEFAAPSEQLEHVDPRALPPLPPPYDTWEEKPWTPLAAATRAERECSLDDTTALALPKPKDKAEEDALVAAFLRGLDKLFTAENNWTFLHPLTLTMEHCARCQTCAEGCHVFLESGRNELYRPTFRSEVLRRLYFQRRSGGSLLSRWQHGGVALTWTTVARLFELAYRCNICRRCAQTCPIGVDNALVARELRKLFSQELGLAPKELHEKGSMLQLRVGSSTGMNSLVVKDNLEFIDEDMTAKSGLPVKTKWDVAGADVLLMHNAGEILAWPENPGAFGILLDAAGVNWTLSSDALAYDAINYGLFYDDVQYARVLLKHVQAAKKLGVKKIVMGECGHAHKAMMVIANRVLPGELAVPAETAPTFLEGLVAAGRLKFDPARIDFPVTLHDPCNLVRLMGVVEPQRRILRRLAPKFREMEPHGVHNFCCGGGSGFAIMSGNNFAEWRMRITSRRKFRQVLEAFRDDLDPRHPKYVCAPCSNCKGALRDVLRYYDAPARVGIHYGGLVELMVHALSDAKPGFIDFAAP